MRLDNRLFCGAAIIMALFAGQAVFRLLLDIRALGGEVDMLYFVLWAPIFAIIVCGLKIWNYGSRRLKVLSIVMMAVSSLLLLLSLPATDLVMQAVVGMAFCIIFSAKLKYAPVIKSKVAPRNSRVRQLLAKK